MNKADREKLAKDCANHIKASMELISCWSQEVAEQIIRTTIEKALIQDHKERDESP